MSTHLMLRFSVPRPTPKDEICDCPKNYPIVLYSALEFNPIHCARCLREISPKEIDWDLSLCDDIANWNSIHLGIECLWLDSREYEKWARKELGSLASPLNKRGRKLVRRISNIRPAYYLVFRDQTNSPLSQKACVDCAGKLKPFALNDKLLVCDKCRLAWRKN